MILAKLLNMYMYPVDVVEMYDVNTGNLMYKAEALTGAELAAKVEHFDIHETEDLTTFMAYVKP